MEYNEIPSVLFLMMLYLSGRLIVAGVLIGFFVFLFVGITKVLNLIFGMHGYEEQINKQL